MRRCGKLSILLVVFRLVLNGEDIPRISAIEDAYQLAGKLVRQQAPQYRK